MLGAIRRYLPLCSLMNFEFARLDHEDRVIAALDGLLVDPELPFVRSSVALFRSVFRGVFDEDRRLDMLLPENVRAAIMPIEIGRNAGNVKPVGADRAFLRRIGELPVDSTVVADGKVAVRMELLEDGPDAPGRARTFWGVSRKFSTISSFSSGSSRWPVTGREHDPLSVGGR